MSRIQYTQKKRKGKDIMAAAQNAPNFDVAHQISLATGLDNVAPNAAHRGRTMAGAIAHELFKGLLTPSETRSWTLSILR